MPPGSVLELNASDDRGIAAVRNEIKEFAGTRGPVAGKPKLIVLDECDAMTRDAQMALRRVMEASVRNARFCLICNYVGKVIPALQSRCARFRFRPLPADAARARVEAVCDAEGVDRSTDPAGVDALLTLGQGDMRRTLNLLQAVAMASQGSAAKGAEEADGARAAAREGASEGAASAPMDVDGPPPSASPSAAPRAAVLTAAGAYACAGKPRPSEARAALASLLNDDLSDAFAKLRALQESSGAALVDLLLAVHPLLFALACPEPARATLIKALADAEQRLAGGSNETLQLGGVLAAFVAFRGAVAKAAR